jgi:ribosomal protein RSM22 (predicted rRNA methylase)
MPCYIVTYELKQPRREYVDFIGAIKSYDDWAQILDSTWAIVTDDSATEVRDHLWALVDPQDGLFIVEAGQDAAWQDVRCENQWLRNHV